MAELAFNRQSRIHATADGQEFATLIKNKIEAGGSDYTNGSSHRAKLTSDHYSTTGITDTELPRDTLSHVTQYNETDLDFICRLCEHYGVYFFFLNDSDSKIVFGNTNTPFTDTESDIVIKLENREPDDIQIITEYTAAQAAQGEDTPKDASDDVAAAAAEIFGGLYSFEKISRPCPRIVRVIDYDSASKTKIEGEYDSSSGQGIHTDQTTHISNTDEGGKFAQIRYQEIKFSNNYCIGITDVPCVAPGYVFMHLPKDSDKSDTSTDKYIITHSEIEMTISHPDPNGSLLRYPHADGGIVPNNFRNEFRCIDYPQAPLPASNNPPPLVFSPPRATPVPRLPGVYSAQIDSDVTPGSNEDKRPVPDSEGTYRIAQQFDERESVAAGRKSTPVRKAGPYAGDDVGMHFPLKRGTEVMVSYRNGDPDQPIIAGALYKEDSGSTTNPVTDQNNTSHQIKTSTSLFEIRDAAHNSEVNARAVFGVRNAKTGDYGTYLRLGQSDSDYEGNYHPTDSNDPGEYNTKKVQGLYTYTEYDINETALGKKNSYANDTYSRSAVGHLLSGSRVTIHAGARDNEPENETDGTLILHSDGDTNIDIEENAIIHVHGNLHERVDGDYTQQVEGDEEIVANHNKKEVILGASSGVVVGAANKVVVGNSNNVMIGMKNSVSLSMDNKLVLGQTNNIFLGMALKISIGGKLAIEGPGNVKIGFGTGTFVKPTINLSNYTTKIEQIAIEMKHIGVKMEKKDLEGTFFNLMMKAGQLKLDQAQLHIHAKNLQVTT